MPKLEEALNFYDPESRPALEAVMKKTMETGEPWDIESLFIPSGSKDKIWVRSLGKAVYSGGKIVKLAGTFQNIDKYKRAEEALLESEEKYRDLFESSRDAIMTLAPPSWAYTSGNPATTAMFRAKNAEEFISFSPMDLSPERQPDGRASAEKAMAMIETAMREGSHLFDWTHKRIGGEEFPATVLLTRIEHAGKRFLQATVRDITEKKLAEDNLRMIETRLRQSEKMEAIGTLAGGIAHDFKSPTRPCRE
jgi:PAS domain S-box-containing protein